MRRRLPSEAERALWQNAMRDAAPLKRRPAARAAAPVVVPPAKSETPPAMPDRASHHAAAPPRPKDIQSPTLDRRTADRLRRGQMAIDGRLDLHGMTQATAHAALDGFIQRMAAKGARTLLVITGKGVRLNLNEPRSAEASIGILRREVPRWLGEAPNRPLILAIREAALRHGGAGALYVLLRRRREAD